MEESMISNGEANASVELSDSSSSAGTLAAGKRARHTSMVSTSKFKGVVLQPNGHWGAQIYANHHRIWLGTFKTEMEAAKAYDSAAIRLRCADSHRNFAWTSITAQEPNFQSLYSTEAVLSMIRDGSYESKFTEFSMNRLASGENNARLPRMNPNGNEWLMCRQLFQKELTPSDVGKLNRLVIPKKFALKYFPSMSQGGEELDKTGNTNSSQLVFYDRTMRLWKFRYCYWRSSQSFVFTRGWNRFVKENQLKANDTITFYMCEFKDNAPLNKKFCMLDAHKAENNSNSARPLVEMSNVQHVALQVDLQLNLGQNVIDAARAMSNAGDEESTGRSLKSEEGELKSFKLFGVQIL